jgi:hypothetical protein
MNCVEFLVWLDTATLEELECFADCRPGPVTNRPFIVGEQGPEVYLPDLWGPGLDVIYDVSSRMYRLVKDGEVIASSSEQSAFLEVTTFGDTRRRFVRGLL